MTTTPLTPAQRDMVAENHNLIYGFLHKHSLNIDDWYDCAAIALCRAAQTYDTGRGLVFSTYAYGVMLNAMRQAQRTAKASKRQAIMVSLDDPDEPAAAYHPPAAWGSIEDDALVNLEFRAWYADLDALGKAIVGMRAAGIPQRDISRTTALAQTTISKRLARYKKQLIGQGVAP